jgi:hypothetical protein
MNHHNIFSTRAYHICVAMFDNCRYLVKSNQCWNNKIHHFINMLAPCIQLHFAGVLWFCECVAFRHCIYMARAPHYHQAQLHMDYVDIKEINLTVFCTAFINQVLCPLQWIYDDVHIAIEANLTGGAHVSKFCKVASGLMAIIGNVCWTDRVNCKTAGNHLYISW